MVKRSYDKVLDTFRHYYLIGACFVFALLVHEKFTVQEVTHCLTLSSFLAVFYSHIVIFELGIYD